MITTPIGVLRNFNIRLKIFNSGLRDLRGASQGKGGKKRVQPAQAGTGLRTTPEPGCRFQIRIGSRALEQKEYNGQRATDTVGQRIDPDRVGVDPFGQIPPVLELQPLQKDVKDDHQGTDDKGADQYRV